LKIALSFIASIIAYVSEKTIIGHGIAAWARMLQAGARQWSGIIIFRLHGSHAGLAAFLIDIGL